MYQVTLPWPPTVNTYWRSVKGRNILSAKARAYKKEAAYFLKSQDLEGELQVEIECNMPDKRRRDLDNLLKPLLDVMDENNVYEDDSQISDLRIYKSDYGEKGTVTITVRELEKCAK
jgi:crossover junction endodeoxyribonuclease RusA